MNDGLVFGLAFLVVTPLFQVPDEPNHFFRSVLSTAIALARKGFLV